MSRKDSHASHSSSKKPRQRVPKNSFCDGLQMEGAPFEKSFVSNGISAHPTPHVRSRSITFNSRMSTFSNWSSCLTSVEERLARRSKNFACLDSQRSCYLRSEAKTNRTHSTVTPSSRRRLYRHHRLCHRLRPRPHLLPRLALEENIVCYQPIRTV